MRNSTTVYIASDPNSIAIQLVNELLSKPSVRVVVITNRKDEFAQIFGLNNFLKIVNFKESVNEIPSYLFLVQGFGGGFFSKTQLKQILGISGQWLPKTQVILPYIITPKNKREIDMVSREARRVVNRNLQVIYVGEIYGSGMDLNSDGYVASVFRNIWLRNNVNIPAHNFEVYVTNIYELVNSLIKGIFSYGFNKKEVVIAKRVKVFGFLERMRKILPAYVNFVTDWTIKADNTQGVDYFVSTKITDSSIKSTVNWLNKNRTNTKPVAAPRPRNQKSNYKPKFKTFFLSVLIFLWILSLPFFSLFVSGLFLRKGFKDLSSTHYRSALPYFNVSQNLSDFPLRIFGSLGFREGREISSTLNDASEIGKRSVGVLDSAKDLSEKMKGDTDYDLSQISQKLYLDLDDLHTRVSFLIADFSTFTGARLFLPQTDFAKLNDYLENVRGIAQKLPVLLGQDKPASYLLLLQDSSNLKATGGAISSLGVFTFDKGKLTEKSFFDVTQIDEQLKGHIEPPAEIKKYLGKTEWRLIDSNWDPDFRVTGSKAEWFLEREIDRFVNGVVAVNLKTYNELKGFNGDFVEWSGRLLSGLNSKDVQIFLNDNLLSAQLENLNWDGGVNDHSIGIVETNLGQPNLDLTQSASLIVDLTGSEIQSRLDLSLRNLSSIYAYKSYMKLILPNGSSLSGENGNLVEIAPGGSKKMTFSWTNKKDFDFTKNGEYLLTLRKQSGLSLPMDVRFILPEFLTGGNLSRYNTGLDRDLDLTVKW